MYGDGGFWFLQPASNGYSGISSYGAFGATTQQKQKALKKKKKELKKLRKQCSGIPPCTDAQQTVVNQRIMAVEKEIAKLQRELSSAPTPVTSTAAFQQQVASRQSRSAQRPFRPMLPKRGPVRRGQQDFMQSQAAPEPAEEVVAISEYEEGTDWARMGLYGVGALAAAYSVYHFVFKKKD